MKATHIQQLRPYKRLLEDFLSGQIPASDFERMFFERHRYEETRWTEEEYQIMERLFEETDAFCADPELRGPDDIDEKQLRAEADVALQGLKSLGV